MEARNAEDAEAPAGAARLADTRRAVGADRAAAPTAEAAPARLSQPARGRPPRDGRHLLPAAHRVPVERALGHWALLVLLGPSTLPGVARRGCVPRAVAARADGVRRPEGHRLELARRGRCDDQGTARGGKPAGATRQTE